MKKIFQLLLLTAALGSCADKPKVCIINGVVKDRPDSKTIYVAPFDTDFRATQNYKIVQIVQDGTFTDTIPFEHSQMYSITFEDEYQRGAWMPINFMLETGTINFVLHSEQKSEENVVEGGALNTRLTKLTKEREEMYDFEPYYDELKTVSRKDYYTPEATELYSKLNSGLTQFEATSINKQIEKLDELGKLYSPKVTAINIKIDSLYSLGEQWQIDQITQMPDEAGLAILDRIIKYRVYKNKPIDDLVDVFEKKYKREFGSNPMTQAIIRDIAALRVVVGAPFVDFTAPDLQGKMVTLSDEIKGKVAVIDLWASWCGPCIATSISFIPVWEKYKDQGFTIVGVAREMDNTDAMKAAIERHKLPWLNLVELNDRTSLWAQYGAGNAGGKVILVDRDGKIVDTDFDAARLEQHLEKLL